MFRGVRRVLRDDGTLWLNLGDSYAAGGNGGGAKDSKQQTNVGSLLPPKRAPLGFKPKDLLMIPARVALTLQADGWYLRSEIIWHKPNPMPESCKDRPTSAHEKVYLFAKSPMYFYNADAIAESGTGRASGKHTPDKTGAGKGFEVRGGFHKVGDVQWHTRNARNVWTISPTPYDGAHFATMPVELAEKCILAGSRVGDTVLDPFGGVGTTGLVARNHARKAILIELNHEYVQMALDRIHGPLFAPTASQAAATA